VSPTDHDGGIEMSDDTAERLRYRLLTGPDDHGFCQRVSEALDAGYVLYGAPSITHGPDGPIVAQAVVLPE
jgi:hypothetical protein